MWISCYQLCGRLAPLKFLAPPYTLDWACWHKTLNIYSDINLLCVSHSSYSWHFWYWSCVRSGVQSKTHILTIQNGFVLHHMTYLNEWWDGTSYAAFPFFVILVSAKRSVPEIRKLLFCHVFKNILLRRFGSKHNSSLHSVEFCYCLRGADKIHCLSLRNVFEIWFSERKFPAFWQHSWPKFWTFKNIFNSALCSNEWLWWTLCLIDFPRVPSVS